MVPCAYLRVFEPVDGADVPARWAEYAARGDGVTARTAVERESRAALARLVNRRTPQPSDLALVRRIGARLFVCPLQLAERHAVALLAFRELLPEPVAEAFVSSDETRGAIATLEQLERPPHIQESSWEVPLGWFTCFDPSERHFVDPPEGAGPRLTYLTVAANALDRIDRAIGVIDAHLEDGGEIVDALGELAAWVASFDRASLIELDYGGLTGLMSPGALATDTSCEDVWHAVDSLERGDADGAIAGYQSASARWHDLRARCRSN